MLQSQFGTPRFFTYRSNFSYAKGLDACNSIVVDEKPYRKVKVQVFQTDQKVRFSLGMAVDYKKRTIKIGPKINGQIVDSTSLNSEKTKKRD